MATTLDSFTLELRCPNCRSEFKKTVRWIKDHRNFPCDCGALFNTQELLRGIEKAAQSLGKLSGAKTIKLKL